MREIRRAVYTSDLTAWKLTYDRTERAFESIRAFQYVKRIIGGAVVYDNNFIFLGLKIDLDTLDDTCLL